MKLKKDLILETARKVFDVEAQAILHLKERLNGAFLEAVSKVTDCKGKVVLTGIGKSGQIARKIASTFSSTGTSAIYLHPAESAHGDLGTIRSEDLVIALSYGGETPELGPIVSYVARKGIPLIVLTGNLEGELAKRATVVLNIKVNREACPLGLAPTASSTATLAMGDALAMAVLEQKGFTIEDFAEFHPGGGLGFKLARIRDLMHINGEIPLLEKNTPIREVLTVMSRGDVRGGAGVVDESGDLVGIITDGDIRRRLENIPNPLEGEASHMMTLTPRTIDAQEIAEKALFMMEQFRINMLFVLDKSSVHPKKPVGLIHIQDLLTARIR